MTTLYNPLLPGFNPDPSVVEVDGAYYLVTSTFEYVPGLPVYRSTDFETWKHIANIGFTTDVIGVAEVPTGLGVWAPTIRFHRGRFFVIVTIPLSPKRCVVYTATDPAGPWDEGTTLEGVDGIDPDLAWDEEGTAYVTFSGLVLEGAELGQHKGVLQVRVDLQAGRALEEPRSMWSGTGLQFPEAPHVFRRGEHWYLMIAEGGTERGHGVSIARGPSIEGPFEGAAVNPVLSHRSTTRPIQNTGHADLVTLPDGDDALVLLGMRPLGGTRAFSPLGRETFATRVRWVDGWPRPEYVALNPRPGVVEHVFAFVDESTLNDPGWLAVRRSPREFAAVVDGRLALDGDVEGLDGPRPVFLGRRQQHLVSTFATTVDASGGAGGLGFRYDETVWVAIEARGTGSGTAVTATAALPGVRQHWSAELPTGEIELRIETSRPPFGFGAEAMGGDRIELVASSGGTDTVLTELDGRYWTAEAAASFTGRVTGVFATAGTVTFGELRYRGEEQS